MPDKSLTHPDHPDHPDQIIIQPKGRHEDLAFEELATLYNFGPELIHDRRVMYVRLLIKESLKYTSPVRMLDIGCGNGISANQATSAKLLRALRAHVDELWGIEPDETIQPEHGIFTKLQHATLENADLPENYFELAHSFMVIEHVAEPKAFLAALFRVLKPGGSIIFMTPNAKHLVVQLAKLLHHCHMDEWVLRLVRGQQGVDSYHYPVQYKLNSTRRIDKLALEVGFEKPQYVFTEGLGAPAYFPGPLRPIHWLLRAKRTLWKNPEVLIELTCRMTKPKIS